MKKNFIVNDDAISVTIDGQYLDLHNCYQIIKVEYINKGISSELILYFEKLREPWTNINDPDNFKFIFLEIEFIEVSKTFFLNLTDAIDEIGYKSKDDFDMDWLIHEKEFDAMQHIIFSFYNCDYLRIYANEINIEF